MRRVRQCISIAEHYREIVDNICDTSDNDEIVHDNDIPDLKRSVPALHVPSSTLAHDAYDDVNTLFSTQDDAYSRLRRCVLLMTQICNRASDTYDTTDQGDALSKSLLSRAPNAVVSAAIMHVNKIGPRPGAQRLLCDIGVLDTTMKLLKHCAELSAANRKRLKRLKYRKTNAPRAVMRLLYRFIAAMVKNSRRAQKYCVRWMQTMLTHMRLGVGSVNTITSIVQNNRDLLENVIDDAHIKTIIDVIRDLGITHSFEMLKFLVVLCRCDGEAVRTNQNRTSSAIALAWGFPAWGYPLDTSHSSSSPSQRRHLSTASQRVSRATHLASL